MALIESLEEKLAWRWLRQQLAAELGIDFRTGGRPRALDPETETRVIAQITAAPPKTRLEMYERLADALGVSAATIQRTWLRFGTEGIAVR